jgi:hypothetical protein
VSARVLVGAALSTQHCGVVLLAVTSSCARQLEICSVHVDIGACDTSAKRETGRRTIHYCQRDEHAAITS